MHDPLTTLTLIVLTLLSLAACVVAIGRLLRPLAFAGARAVQYTLFGACITGCMTLFLYRAWVVHHGWQPLQSHVDGLLLIALLFAVMVLFLQSRGGVWGLTTFGLPVLTVILAWSICASFWTFQWFQIDSVWKTVHLAGVYLGTLFFLVAAIAGGMFLYAHRRLQRKRDGAVVKKLASLESIERLIVWSSTVGFGLLTLGLATGVVIIGFGPNRLGAGWWHSPKVVLAASVWLIYFMLINTRHAVFFRGTRAAWLSIVGLVLLLTTFGVVNMWAAATAPPPPGAGGGDPGLLHQEVD